MTVIKFKDPMASFPSNKSFFEHLEDARWHILRSLIYWLMGCGFAYPYAAKLQNWLIAPLGKVYFTSPAEGLTSYLTVLMVAGGILALPFILGEIWSFAVSALSLPERRAVRIFLPLAIILFVSGIVFAYLAVLPLALKFFMSFATDNITPMITVGKYIQYVASFCLSFGLVFETPLVFVFLTKIGIATPAYLIHFRRQAYVGIFVISAVLTPPDYVSQLLMAGPLLALYEIGIWLSKMVYRPRPVLDFSSTSGV